jgi:hypothetical protein
LTREEERAFVRYVNLGAAREPYWAPFGFDEDDPARELPFGRIVSDAEGTTLCTAESRAAAELISLAMNELNDRLEAEGAFKRGYEDPPATPEAPDGRN